MPTIIKRDHAGSTSLIPNSPGVAITQRSKFPFKLAQCQLALQSAPSNEDWVWHNGL